MEELIQECSEEAEEVEEEVAVATEEWEEWEEWEAWVDSLADSHSCLEASQEVQEDPAEVEAVRALSTFSEVCE